MGCQLISLFLVFYITILVIGFIYIFSWNYNRSTEEGIKLRMFGILFAIFTSILTLLTTGHIDYETLTPNLSLSPYFMFESIIVPVVLTITLFIGPIIDRYKEGTLLVLDPDESISPFYILLRNYIVCPIVEEYIYRFLLSAILIKCFTNPSTVLISSALFSLSHVHHHIKILINGAETADWIIFLCHLLHTFIFACYACSIYLRAKSIVALFLIHSFCNWIGPPRLDRLFNQKYLAISTSLGLVTCISLLSIYVTH